MRYLLLIAGNTEYSSDGTAAPAALAAMQRDIPRWAEEMNSRGVRLFSQELDLPATAATARVRDGETLVTDGPFAETKEFVAGFTLLECAALDEAVAVAASSPVSWFNTMEVRPFAAGTWLTDDALGRASREVSAASSYLLMTWRGENRGARKDDEAVAEQADGWRRDLETRGLLVLGGALGGPEMARTVRVRDGQTVISDGPFTETTEFIGGVDVVSCADRQGAIDLAAQHPAGRHHAIEVRPFYSE
jgi:hypothetical protein